MLVKNLKTKNFKLNVIYMYLLNYNALKLKINSFFHLINGICFGLKLFN